MKSKKPDGPLNALVGKAEKEGLMKFVSSAGIRKIMVDIPILDLSSVGLAPYSAQIIKEKLNVPVGAAPANAAFTNTWLMDREKTPFEKFRTLNATICAYLVAKGCNFLFFGPREGAPWVLPACALADAMNVYGARHRGVSPGMETHPMFKIL